MLSLTFPQNQSELNFRLSLTIILGFLRSAQTRKHCCRHAHSELMLLTMLYGCANGKEAKHFCFRDANFASSRYVAWVRKRGNIRETFSQYFFSVSQVIPRLLSHATYVENTKSSSWKQKMLLRFSKNIFCVLDAFLLPQQCFLVCAGLY